MFLASRNLRHDPIQVFLTVTGIAVSVMLVVILLGVLSGVQRQAADYLTHVPGSVIVASAGTENFFMVPLPLPPGATDAVREADGVESVVPLLSQMVVLQLHERREATFVVGYEPALGGGPNHIISGRQPEGEGEIVLGRVLASRHGIEVGDPVGVMGQTLRVSGLADDPSPLMTSFVYIPRATLEPMLPFPDQTSVLVVTPSDGVSPEALGEQLARIPDASVLLKSQVIANDIAIFTGPFQPVIRLMAAIALLAGTLVVGLLIYTATIQRQREYGVLKAVGSTNRRLFQTVISQALIVAITGVTVGLGLAAVVARVIMQARPEFLIPVTPDAMLIATGAGLVMALFASMAPARVIAGLAPADVFRR